MADSHVGECLPRLPAEVADRLRGSDLVLHAGDITDLSVLRTLGEIAPVVAVQGDHDRAAGILPPRARVVPAGRFRIGLTHGRRPRPVELVAASASLLSGRPRLLGFHRALRRRFGTVHCIVHGHLHLPDCRVLGGVLFVTPGAVYLPERDPGYGDGLGARAYLRFRRRQDPALRVPSVGMIEAGPDRLVARVLPLDPDLPSWVAGAA